MLSENLRKKYAENLKPPGTEPCKPIADDAAKKARLAAKNENWKRISQARLARLKVALRVMGNLAGSSYIYSQDEARTLLAEIAAEVDNLSKKLAKRFS